MKAKKQTEREKSPAVYFKRGFSGCLVICASGHFRKHRFPRGKCLLNSDGFLTPTVGNNYFPEFGVILKIIINYVYSTPDSIQKIH